jgi:hypothetical protein
MRDCPVTLRPGDAEEFTNDLINSVTSSTVPEEPKTFVFEQDPLPFEIEERVASYASGAESTTTVPATPTSSVVDESEVPTSTVESSGDSASSPQNPETSDAGSETSGPPTETTAASSTSLVSTTTITEVQESFVPLPSPEPLVVPEYGPIPDERILDSARAFLSTPTAVTTTRPATSATTSTDVELMRQILSVLASLPDNEIPESSAELPVIAYVRQGENNGATGTGGGDVAVVGSGFFPQSQVVVADRRGTVRASSLSSDAGQVNLTVEIPSTGDRSLVVLAGKDAEGVRRAIPVIVTNLPASSDESTLTAGAGEDMPSTTTTAEHNAVEGVDPARDEPPPQGDEPAVLWWFALLVTVLLVGLRARNRRRRLAVDHNEAQSS